MTNDPALVGATFIAVGSTIQAIRWALKAWGSNRRAEYWDVLGWALIAVGSWYAMATAL